MSDTFDEDYGEGNFPRTITVRVTKADKDRLSELATQFGTSVSEFVREYLEPVTRNAETSTIHEGIGSGDTKPSRIFERLENGSFRELIPAHAKSAEPECERCGIEPSENEA